MQYAHSTRHTNTRARSIRTHALTHSPSLTHSRHAAVGAASPDEPVLTVSEMGTEATVLVWLSDPPTSGVVAVSSAVSDTSEARILSGDLLEFDGANWNEPQVRIGDGACLRSITLIYALVVADGLPISAVGGISTRALTPPH